MHGSRKQSHEIYDALEIVKLKTLIVNGWAGVSRERIDER